VALVLGTGSALAIAVSPAAALKTRSATSSTLNGNGELVATAHCHDGERVVSGGFADSPEGAAVVSRAAGRDGWTVHTYPGSSSLTTYAYCSTTGGVSTASDHVQVTRRSNTKAKARCGRGDVAVSGGYKFGNEELEGNSPAFSSRRAGTRGWSILALLAETPARLDVFAYCQHDADVIVRTAQAHIPGGPSDTTGSATVKCHPGEKLLSGGYKTTPTPDWDNSAGPDFFYYGSKRVGPRGWKASAINYSDVGGKIVAYAYCAA
jgi:hypothetical protein